MARQRILVLVKTYPNPSAKYQETVCVAGVNEAGEWLRLYPIPFRKLLVERQFSKFDWIEADLSPSPDSRPESRRVDADSIQIVGRLEPKHWESRRELVLAELAPSIEALVADNTRTGRSLGVIQPAVHAFRVTPEDNPDWTPEELEKLTAGGQLNLFEPDHRTQLLQKVPYRFAYQFTCRAEGCRGHQMAVHDWEVYQFCRRLPRHDPDRVLMGMQRKFFEELARSRDLYFIIGTMRAHPTTWTIIGLFYPPRETQLRLAFD